ncbi:hypothetical protein TTHERM_00721490 (macronuclear) [Tetrahymena thermophila SB210]|uniref:Uncharacterized protein n=1 Tax=Tetrahymena thermophila (strain SB210) TaxID=312017 RepID=Q22G08_TETTS|nr:hypothetical protein TTHERM_00721490 [Tetrahymena thermophila SB210]EAR84218.1 hypothetical protein TTHERM_00721490 [Tetrahymena thermophila SB210]|eukprot:XP_001031881.1 hypothetical protein TTHERM_00721490 [Tetrahymena thermophila SB210]
MRTFILVEKSGEKFLDQILRLQIFSNSNKNNISEWMIMNYSIALINRVISSGLCEKDDYFLES